LIEYERYKIVENNILVVRVNFDTPV